MKTLIFNTKAYDRKSLDLANQNFEYELDFLEARLTPRTATLAKGYRAISAFVNDDLGAETLAVLAESGVEFVALRCAGFNQVDLTVAKNLGIEIARVPAYSPYAVAEHTLGLILSLNRHIHRAYQRVREQNFSLEGLLGFDLHGKKVGVIGTGKIGAIVTRILLGFGCQVLAYDQFRNPECEALGVRYLDTLDKLWSEVDILTLHCPLTPETKHLINADSIQKMKAGVMLINTSRGALVDTQAVIDGLKSGQVGYLGLDVYEEESELFFQDHSDEVLQDDLFSRLLTFPNVLITGHQAYFTKQALENIAQTTLENLHAFTNGDLKNTVKLP